MQNLDDFPTTSCKVVYEIQQKCVCHNYYDHQSTDLLTHLLLLITVKWELWQKPSSAATSQLQTEQSASFKRNVHGKVVHPSYDNCKPLGMSCDRHLAKIPKCSRLAVA